MVYLWKCSMCIWKECVFSFFRMKDSIYISVKSIWSRILFNAAIFLLTFCLEDISIFDSGVLKSPITIVLLSMSRSPQRFSLCICVLLCWVDIYLQYLCLLSGFFPWVLWITFWVSFYGPLFFEVYIVWYEYCYPGFSFIFFFLSIYLEYFFLHLHF